MPKTAPAPASPSLVRRELEKAETRRLIMDAARTMFTQVGYAETTMRGIAERIGYTATTIYHHFEDKNALMLELCANDFRELGRALTTLSGVSDPVERIRQMGRNYILFALQNREQFRFMFLIERPMPGPDDLKHLDPGEDGYLFLKQAVTEALAAKRFRPEFTDPDLIAQIFWGGVHGIATIHVTTPPGGHKWLTLREPKLSAASMCDVLMRGLLR